MISAAQLARSVRANNGIETAIVTKTELLELREWEEDLAKYKKKASEAEKQVELRREILVEKVLGLQSKDELKVLPLEKVQKIFAKRQAAGLWELQKGAPVFAFELTSARQYPAWKELYIMERGEAAANQRAAETPHTFSYRIEIAQPL